MSLEGTCLTDQDDDLVLDLRSVKVGDAPTTARSETPTYTCTDPK
jgi:hypothetical protein